MKMEEDDRMLLLLLLQAQREKEWEVAQSLQLFDLDLISAAKSQLRLLAAVDSSYPHRHLYSGPDVQRAILRCYSFFFIANRNFSRSSDCPSSPSFR